MSKKKTNARAKPKISKKDDVDKIKEVEALSQDSSEDIVDSPQKENSSLKGFIVLLSFLAVIVILALSFIFIQRMNQKDENLAYNYEYWSSQIEAGYEDETHYAYNDYIFVKMDNSWLTKVDKAKKVGNTTHVLGSIPFYSHYGPKEVEDIPLNVSDLMVFNNKQQVILSFNPDLGQYITLAGLEFAKIFVTFYDWPKDAFLISVSENVSTSFPQKTCADADENNAVVIFDYGNETKIEREGYCMKVIGTNEEEVLKASDRLMFTLLGIIR